MVRIKRLLLRRLFRPLAAVLCMALVVSIFLIVSQTKLSVEDLSKPPVKGPTKPLVKGQSLQKPISAHDVANNSSSVALAVIAKKPSKTTSECDYTLEGFEECLNAIVGRVLDDPIPSPSDWTAIGDLMRRYQRVYNVMVDVATHGTTHVHSIDVTEAMLSKFESLLFPWFIKGPLAITSYRAMTRSKGRGIVLTTGSKYALVAKHTILMMRSIGCSLPIQIMYYGDKDLALPEQKILSELKDVELVDLKSVLWVDGSTVGWHLKPLAVLASRFRHVIMIDADALFFQRPEVLYDMKGYSETGALLFRDRSLKYLTWGYGPATISFLRQIAAPYADGQFIAYSRIMNKVAAIETDSGIVVWDKARVMPVIMATALMNTAPYLTSFLLSSQSMGDKESFWIAHEALHAPFVFGPGNGGSIGTLHTDPTTNRTKVCGEMYHPDDSGKPLWFNGGIGVRERAKDLKIRRPQYWAIEYSGIDVDWVYGVPICLYGEFDTPLGGTGVTIARLSEEEEALGSRMVDLWIELLQINE
ncbi:hypothetical protein BASA83_012807 [Batrachochytrium salamandrivorans]|nr:hypothetical protein BASA83_012807 [Batrachochytrium salamandrivorans]